MHRMYILEFSLQLLEAFDIRIESPLSFSLDNEEDPRMLFDFNLELLLNFFRNVLYDRLYLLGLIKSILDTRSAYSLKRPRRIRLTTAPRLSEYIS